MKAAKALSQLISFLPAPSRRWGLGPPGRKPHSGLSEMLGPWWAAARGPSGARGRGGGRARAARLREGRRLRSRPRAEARLENHPCFQANRPHKMEARPLAEPAWPARPVCARSSGAEGPAGVEARAGRTREGHGPPAPGSRPAAAG